MLRSVILAIFAVFLVSGTQAQCGFLNSSQSTVLNDPLVYETMATKRVVPYTHLRQADVMWSKRVWRIIDLREKINHPLYFPLEPTHNRASLFDLIKCSLESGSITAYNPGPLLDDDEFRVPHTPAEVQEILMSYEVVMTPRLDDDGMDSAVIENPLESSEIKQYMLKEDWFFDRQRSVLDVRIIGIAPMKEIIGDEDGEVRGYAPVFWLYFPECRYVFQNAVVFNRQNSTHTMSFDDLFHKRYFSSYIIKESNVYDRKINEEYAGIDALLDADRVKNEIFLVEHDLWHF